MALALKELGFSVFKMFGWYIKEDDSDFGKSLHALDDRNFCFNAEYCVKAPLWQQVEEWFREKHNLDISYKTGLRDRIKCYTYSFPFTDRLFNWNAYNTYEEAREAAVLEAIKLLKGEKK